MRTATAKRSLARQGQASTPRWPSTVQGAGAKEDGQQAAQPYFLSKYKTQLCIYFERQGYCT